MCHRLFNSRYYNAQPIVNNEELIHALWFDFLSHCKHFYFLCWISMLIEISTKRKIQCQNKLSCYSRTMDLSDRFYPILHRLCKITKQKKSCYSRVIDFDQRLFDIGYYSRSYLNDTLFLNDPFIFCPRNSEKSGSFK